MRNEIIIDTSIDGMSLFCSCREYSVVSLTSDDNMSRIIKRPDLFGYRLRFRGVNMDFPCPLFDSPSQSVYASFTFIIIQNVLFQYFTYFKVHPTVGIS